MTAYSGQGDSPGSHGLQMKIWGFCKKRIDLSSGSRTNWCPLLEVREILTASSVTGLLRVGRGVALSNCRSRWEQKLEVVHSKSTVRETERTQRRENSANNQRTRMDWSPKGTKDLSLNLWVNSHSSVFERGKLISFYSGEVIHQ